MADEVLELVEGANGYRGVAFTCPGCSEWHVVTVAAVHGRVVWQFNGDLVRPTISPSLLVTWNQGEARTPHRCHSFIRDGRIEFLGDCTHALAGQTVPLPPVAAGGTDGE